MNAPPLRCPDCGATYADRWRCECGHPLEYESRPLPDAPAPDPAAFDVRDGLWAFSEFLPESPLITLGEGMTPLVDADEWGAQFKLEYVFPTGSFKDRGATTTVSRAAALGVDTLVEDSSGNAGAAIATYAARAGIDAEIYVPASVKDAKLRAIRRAGATPVRTEGPRQATTDACIGAVERAARDADAGASSDEPRVTRAGWYASHAWNPAFFAGTATFAYEAALQRDWEAPDAVVLPLGHGTLFLGAYRGFRALRDAGWTDEVPRLLGVQAAGHAPIVEALHGADAAAGDNDAADGIQIPDPVRRDQILDAIDDTDGDAVAVGGDAVETELADLHVAGFYTEPTCAVAPAALRVYREHGVLDDDEDVVVPLTGSGLKT